MIKRFEIDIPTVEEIKSQCDSIVEAINRKLVKLETWIFSKGNQTFWRLAFETTHRCGSRESGHYPVFNNPKTWLWNVKEHNGIQRAKCQICSEAIQVKVEKDLGEKHLSKRGREADIQDLQRLYATATNETERTAIKKSLSKINHEPKQVRAMRDKLIKETREHNHANIKDIHDDVVGKGHYSNER